MDVFLQTSHQSHCCRIARFHSDENNHVFPHTGFGTEAYEVGPRSNKEGPCLLLLRKVTVTTTEFLSWLNTSLLERYILRVYWIDPDTIPAASEEDLLDILRNSEAPTHAVRLQCNPRRLERCLQDQLPLSWKLDPGSFEEVLSVVQCDGKLHWHLHPASSLYKNPPSHFSAGCVSSAMHKLQEALQLAGLDIEGLKIALDLGAAPGGWTMLLARKVQHVLAIDNADLAPEALLGNVVHIRQLAQNAKQEILRHTEGQLADILVSDMNLHIMEAIKPIKALLGLLRQGAILIVTLKFFGVGREPRKWESIIKADLTSNGFGDCQVIWSLANTVNERTLIARKLGSS